MKVDETTLADLELIVPDDRADSILKKIDTAITMEGRRRLKERFTHPFNRIEAIETVQATLRFLADHASSWQLTPLLEEVFVTEKYLQSTIVPIASKNRLVILYRSIPYRLQYPRYYDFIVAETENFIAFLHQVEALCRVRGQLELPALLQSLFEAMAQVLAEEAVHEVLTRDQDNELSFIDHFYYDATFRVRLRQQLLAMIDHLYELDALYAMAQAVVTYRLAFPEFRPSHTPLLELTGLFHPFLQNPTRNDLRLASATNFMFLTGPNMAGKTTYMKACGVAVYLAHLGMGIPARQGVLSLFDGIFCSINTSDNLSLGYSYFYSEVRRVKEAAIQLHLHGRLLLLFDELFKGTNVKDAYDCSQLVIAGFLRWRNGLFILSSHLIELAEAIDGNPQVLFHHFESRVVDGTPLFSYRLAEGISRDRLGLLILNNEQVVELLEGEKDRESKIENRES